jgi:tetratricopeptide (TPR) repeat protein
MMQSNHRRAAVVVLTFLTMQTAFSAPKPVATVHTLSGTLTVQRKGAAAFAPLKLHDPLYVGDVVTIPPNSKASLLFKDGSESRLNANSAVEVLAPVAVGKGKQSLLRVIVGEVMARVRPNRALQTRSVVAGARGTTLHLKVEDDGTTTMTVMEGEVDFFNALGAVVVGASQQSVARPDAAPTAPVTLSVQNVQLIIEWTLELDRAIIPREKFFITPDRKAAEGELPQRSGRVRLQPNDADARRDYGDALFDSGKFEDALQEYQESSRLVPRQPATLTRIGYALMELDRLNDAEQSFRDGGAYALFQTGNTIKPSRISTLEEGASPARAPALVGLATLALVRDRPAEAQRTAEQAVAADGNSAEARIALGLALMRQAGKLTEAAQAFQAALAAEPSSYRYQARAWRALVYSAQGDAAAALREAQAATHLAPQSALARGNLALVYFFGGKTGDALREAWRATQLNPESVAARCALAQSLLARGDVDAAAQAAAQAVALDPSLPQARYLLGVADAQRRDLSHAARELKECLHLAPDFLPAVSALARVYTAMGRKQEAVTLLTDLLPRHRNTDGVRAALGAVYYQQANYKEAETQYQEALKLKPNSALYHAELARVLLDDNRLTAAMNTAQKAAQLAPSVAQYHAMLGLAYDFSGLSSQAERELRAALALDPQNALARALLALKSVGARTLLNTLTQAFMFDSTISTQLLRGGIDTEIVPGGGSEHQRNFRTNHRSVAADGRFHSLGILDRRRDDGDRQRENDDIHSTVFTENLTLIADPRTNLFANLTRVKIKQGLPGPASSPIGDDLDDRTTSRLQQGQIAARRRVGAGDYLWAGVTYQAVRGATVDPDALNDPDGLFASQMLDARIVLPELRADLLLNADPTRPTVLTLGVARVRADSLLEIDPVVLPVLRSDVDRNFSVRYAQLAQRVSGRFSFVAQLRGQRDVIEGATVRALLLPSVLASYQVDARTNLRLFVNRRAREFTTVAFAPTETLLTTESATLPNGTANTMRTVELDAERYLRAGEFVKLFLFRTAATDLELGGDAPAAFPPTLLLARVRRTGVGLRYERQLTSNLFANVVLVASRTLNSTPGAAFDGGAAPYHPKRSAALALDYVDPAGTKLRLRLRSEGAFFQDSPLVAGRPRFPSRLLVDFGIAKEPSVHTEFFVRVLNVFNRSQIQFRDFPAGRRRVEFGVTRRF